MWTIRSASKLIHSANVIVAFLIIGSCGGHRPRIRPAISCLGAFWTPAATARGRVRHAGVQKPAQKQTWGVPNDASGPETGHQFSWSYKMTRLQRSDPASRDRSWERTARVKAWRERTAPY